MTATIIHRLAVAALRILALSIPRLLVITKTSNWSSLQLLDVDESMGLFGELPDS